MPPEGVALKSHEDILSYEQIVEFVRTAVTLGIEKVRLTGGEPLIRRDIEALIAGLSRIDGLRELCMTTNGTRLAGMAATLKESGLDRVNVSVDSLDPVRYRQITRGGDLEAVLAGIHAARDAGLKPVKVNMVIMEDTTRDDVAAMEAFCEREGLLLQKIMRFSLYDRNDLVRRFHSERPPSCDECNRIRLTADGFLKPCLFSEDEIKVDFEDLRRSILQAVAAKPANGSACGNRAMRAIGG
jgi:cyclic pyranopterin phosphate synthase